MLSTALLGDLVVELDHLVVALVQLVQVVVLVVAKAGTEDVRELLAGDEVVGCSSPSNSPIPSAKMFP